MQMQSVSIKFSEVHLIGENTQGYQFAVGKLNDRWLGFAIGELPEGKRMLFVFPEVGCNGRAGIDDRDKAIRLTGAVAQDPEHGYGGIENWLVPPELHGDPDEFRCLDCGDVGCQGECHDAMFDYVEELP